MKDVKLYWLPNCSTCQKAVKWLERRGVQVTKFHDLKESPMNREEIEGLAKMVGTPNDLFSRRAIKYREMKLNERDLKHDEMLDLMTEDYTFLKRPIMMIGNKVIAGFFEKTHLNFLDDNYYKKSKLDK